MTAFKMKLWPAHKTRYVFALLVTASLLVGLSGCLTLRLLGRLGKTLPEGPGKPLTIPAYSVRQGTPPNKTIAGAARVDITPPPGYPTGGDSLAGGVARGYWTRLNARAFYFEKENGHRLVLVSAELFAIPEALHAKVAQLLNGDWEAVEKAGAEANLGASNPAELNLTVGNGPLPLSPDELIISATHTHQGPGNYLSSKVYNSFASMYSGFDRGLFDFLASRIAVAVAAAAHSARTNAGDVSLKLHVNADTACHQLGSDLCGYRQQMTRNRMPFVIGLNPDRDEAAYGMNPGKRCGPRLCADKSGLPVPASFDGGRFCEPENGFEDTQGCPRLQSVDPRMTVLEVSKSTGTTERVMGLLVFFAAHPTVLAPDSPVNNGDFASVAMAAVERRHADQPVAAFFNGAEGDIHMRRLRRDFRDAVRLGTLFERAVFETLHTGPQVATKDPEISAARIEVTEFAAGDPKHPGRLRTPHSRCALPIWKEAALAVEPQYGVAGLGGGEGDETVLVGLGWREGVRSQPQKGQGPKLPGLDSSLLRNLKITDLVAPAEDFPAHLPVTYARLGPLAIGAFPAELTSTMGYRIRRSLELDTPVPAPDRPWFVLVGLANSYSSYVATPDEYFAQDYVGASTMWGPHEGLALGCGLESLLHATKAQIQTEVPSVVFHPGPPSLYRLGPAFTGDFRTYPVEELNDVLLDPLGRPAVDLPWFSWTESVAGCKTNSNEGCADFPSAASRAVVIEVWNGTKWTPRSVSSEFDVGPKPPPLPPPQYKAGPPPPDDDKGNNLVTLLMDASAPPSRTWAAVWAASLFEESVPQNVPFHFRVGWRGSTLATCSAAMTLSQWTALQADVRKQGGKPGPLAEASCTKAPPP